MKRRPFTILSALSLLLCVAAAVLWVRRQRGRKGLCAACGYDLRASKQRCPECGTAVPAEA